MSTQESQATLSADDVRDWLVEKIAQRLAVAVESVDVDQVFDEFEMDSTEALILAGELEKWLGIELETTALWYHPTISELASYIAEEVAG